MRKLLIVGACAGLVACGGTPGADIILSLDENVQADALRACHADLGIAGPFVPQKIPLKNGQTSVFVSNGNGVTLAEARSVNRCASERLLATYGGSTISHNAKAQGAAIHACKKERGVPGEYTTQVFSYGTRKTEVQIVPSHAVTKKDARAINACAKAKLNGGVTAATSPVVTAPAAAPRRAARTSTPRPALKSSGICPKHASVLYGGTTYCVGN